MRAAVVVVAGVVVAAVVGFVGWQVFADDAPSTSVVVLGDSITDASAERLTEELSPRGEVEIAAVIGATFEVSRRSAGLLGRRDPDVAVVFLGTNDVWTGGTVEEILADADAVLDELAGACLVMVTVNAAADAPPVVEGAAYDNAVAADLNRALSRRADQVVDWHAAVNHDPARYLEADTIHPTPAGSALLASLVGPAVDACAEG